MPLQIVMKPASAPDRPVTCHGAGICDHQGSVVLWGWQKMLCYAGEVSTRGVTEVHIFRRDPCGKWNPLVTRGTPKIETDHSEKLCPMHHPAKIQCMSSGWTEAWAMWSWCGSWPLIAFKFLHAAECNVIPSVWQKCSVSSHKWPRT